MRFLPLALTSAALLCLSASLHADPLLSENFNGLTANLGVTSVGAFSAINGTNVDIVGPGDGFGFLCASPAGGNCVDLDGTGGNPQGQLQSNMQFGAGTYLLSFDLIGNGRGSTSEATVTFGDYTKTFLLGSSDTSTGVVADQLVTLAAPGYLLFASNDFPGDQVGLVLDNVTVSSSVTPEPSSFALLGTGILAMAGTLRKRFA